MPGVVKSAFTIGIVVGDALGLSITNLPFLALLNVIKLGPMTLGSCFGLIVEHGVST